MWAQAWVQARAQACIQAGVQAWLGIATEGGPMWLQQLEETGVDLSPLCTCERGRPPPEPDVGEVIRSTHRLAGNPPPPLNFWTRALRSLPMTELPELPP